MDAEHISINIQSPWSVLIGTLGLRHDYAPEPEPYFQACREANERISANNRAAILANIRKAKMRGITSKAIEEITGFTRQTIAKHTAMLLEDELIEKRRVSGVAYYFSIGVLK